MTSTRRGPIVMRAAAMLLTAACMLLFAPSFEAQTAVDICGCASIPNLQPFDSTDPNKMPAGTSDNGSTLRIPLPPDGILRFSSFNLVNRYVNFIANAANTPVTILVAGDVTMNGNGCCYSFSVSAAAGSSGNSSIAGVGGAGGNGGFRGGDGANQAINAAAIGGAGFGPGGGNGGTPSPLASGSGGTFLGVPELLPLVGGSGGGGGASSSAGSTSCSGGGGGGGGGALLIAANGTLTLFNYQMLADGGNGGGQGNGNCDSPGGAGSGGAIRLAAQKLVALDPFSGAFARGGSPGGTNGRVRLESIDTSAQTQFAAIPPALRVVGPTPLANPVNPTVSITSVGGNAVPAVPQGTFGAIDVVLPAPGPTPVVVATSGVPSGTTVAISVKPRIGAQPVVQTVPLANCDAAGSCGAAATFDLPAGAYVIEARATFQVQ